MTFDGKSLMSLNFTWRLGNIRVGSFVTILTDGCDIENHLRRETNMTTIMKLTAGHLMVLAGLAGLASAQDVASAGARIPVVGRCKVNIAAGKAGSGVDCSLRDSDGNTVGPKVPVGQILQIENVSGYCLKAANDPPGAFALINRYGWLNVPIHETVILNGRQLLKGASAVRMSFPEGAVIRASAAFPREVSQRTVCAATFHGYFDGAPATATAGLDGTAGPRSTALRGEAAASRR